MSTFLRNAVLAPIGMLAVGLNTVLHVPVLLSVALVKLIPLVAIERWCNKALIAIAQSWVGINSALIDHLTHCEWTVEGLDGLQPEGWYLVLSNHQSWVDIPVLQKVFNRRIPFLKFFLKDQLIWVPLLGLAWWALDFPFMKRYTKSQLAKRPELAGKDVEATRKACAKFAKLPVSVMNFVEGTRLTPAKHARQQSTLRHLLRPKAGGVAFVLEAMGEIMQAVVDVTIVYPDGRPTILDLFAGRLRRVYVHVRQREIPAEVLQGGYETDPKQRVRVQAWMNEIWKDKDQRIEELLQRARAT